MTHGIVSSAPIVLPGEDDPRATDYVEKLRISLAARATVMETEQRRLHLDLDGLRAKAAGRTA